MTASFNTPDRAFDDHDAPTVRRPQPRFGPSSARMRPVGDPTWRAGWVVSGLAAALALAALGAVGTTALHVLGQPGPAPSTVSSTVSITAPATRSVRVVPPAAAPAPSTTAVPPGRSAPGPIVGAPSVVIVTAPPSTPVSSSSVQKPGDPVAPPPLPDGSHNPPSGIDTCDFVACDGDGTPLPDPHSPSIPACGDFVACTPVPATEP